MLLLAVTLFEGFVCVPSVEFWGHSSNPDDFRSSWTCQPSWGERLGLIPEADPKWSELGKETCELKAGRESIQTEALVKDLELAGKGLGTGTGCIVL